MEHELEKLSEIYLSHKNYTPQTLKSYRIAFKHYINYLKDHDIDYAKTSDVIRYREQKRDLGHSTHYIYIHICALKGLYQYLKTNQRHLLISDHYTYDIMEGIKNENIQYHISKTILTLEQARHLILHTKKIRKSIWHYRNHAIVYLMLTAGLRSHEIIALKKEDYLVEDGKSILYIRKKGQDKLIQRVSITPGVKDAMDAYLSRRKDTNPYLFITTKNTSPDQFLSRTFFMVMFRRVLEDCGLDGLGITPHALRHTAGMMNLLRGGSVEATKSLLRHVNIKSTVVYQDYLERLLDHTELEIENYILKEDFGGIYQSILNYLES
ncbi:MAG: site-specific integrase [Firmicutes bacterium]|nr:site-specific integrase [Bacillota bacterium]